MKLIATTLILAALISLIVIAIKAGTWIAIAILVLCVSTFALLVWALITVVQAAGKPHAGDIDEP